MGAVHEHVSKNCGKGYGYGSPKWFVACGAFLSDDKERVEEKRQIPQEVEPKSGEEPEVCL